MKVIFSRKGFDSTAGGCPSPIIDGMPVSLPIPSKVPTPTRFGDLNGFHGSLVDDLTRGRITARDWCHLDPDIDPQSLPRKPGWRGALGQTSAAQRHLANQEVGVGDLFLFWGLFRPAEYAGRWRFTGRPEHRIWGWLHIGDIIELGKDGSHIVEKLPWLCDHPHARAGWNAQNVLYVASERLSLGPDRLPGYGIFKSGYRLSEAGARPSTWRVPDWLNPRRGGSGMTYHPLHCWLEDGTLRSATRGQEFVTTLAESGRAVEWLAATLREAQT